MLNHLASLLINVHGLNSPAMFQQTNWYVDMVNLLVSVFINVHGLNSPAM